MGVTTFHAQTIERDVFAKQETSFGVYEALSAVDALRVLAFSDESFTQAREPRADHTGSHSVQDTIDGNIEVPWSTQVYAIPSGTAGTPPEEHELLKTAFGKYTNTPATSDKYEFSPTQGARKSLTLLSRIGHVSSSLYIGAVIDTFSFSVSGANHPSWTFSGRAKQHIHTGFSDVISITATDVTVAEPENYEAGSRVYFTDANGVAVGDGTITGNSSGFRVVSKSGSILTLDTDVAAAGATAADFLAPWAPVPTYAGSPIERITGSFLLAGAAAPMTEFGVDIDHAVKYHDDEALQATFPDYADGQRVVTGTMQLRAARGQIKQLGVRKLATNQTIATQVGSIAGSILTHNIGAAQPMFADPSLAQDDVLLNLPFRALDTAGTETEYSATYT